MPMAEDFDTRDGLLHRRSFVHMTVAALASFVAGSAYAQGPQKAGVVESIRGEGFAETGRARRNLQHDAPVFIADRVSTGANSRLTIHLGQQTRVRLGERARITVDRFLVNAGGDLKLESGAVFFEQPPGGKPSRVRIRSAFGLIAVRGTRFFAGPSAGVFGVFVERGSVAVRAAGKQVIVRAGEGTNIRRPGAAPTPPAPWGQPRIDAALNSVF